MEAVAWIERRVASLSARDAHHGAEPDDDVAKAQRLSGDELGWLSGFLDSPQAPPNTMPFEMLDGFLTALVIGPALVPPSEYVPKIWGAGDISSPTWDSREQAEHFFNLLMKHWNAIAARRAADAAHVPYLEHFGDALPGEQGPRDFWPASTCAWRLGGRYSTTAAQIESCFRSWRWRGKHPTTTTATH